MTDYKPTQLMIDWIKELRNPERVQAEGALCTMDRDGNKSYCCLGVVEEVAGNTTPEVDPKEYPEGVNLGFHGPTAKGETGLPSAALIDAIMGVQNSCRDNVTLCVDVDGSRIEASEANDDFGWSFEQIADQLEKVYVLGTGNPEDYTIENLDRPIGDDSDCW